MSETWTVDSTDDRESIFITFDLQRVSMDGVTVYKYYYGDEDRLMLLTRHGELELDLPTNELRIEESNTTLRVSLPEEFVEKLVTAVEDTLSEKTF